MQQISKPGLYAGFSEPKYDSFTRHSEYVEVQDGTKLAVDYYIPSNAWTEASGRFPVIFEFTPYDRICYKSNGEKSIESYDYYTTEACVELYTSYGYVYARADVRGKGASFGTRTCANSRQEASDGRDIVEWLAAQEWSTGRVGLVGSSYTGQTQLEIISKRPKHLKAAVVGCTDYNHYDGWIRGGIARAFGANPDVLWDHQGGDMTIDKMVANTVPVDEDTDKIMLREAIQDHINNGLQIPIFRDLLWRNSISESTHDDYWNQVSASTYKQDINDSGVAMYLLGGLHDVFRRDTFIIYENLTVPKKLTCGDWYHCMAKYNPAWPIEHLRWFDYWLKDIDNGICDEPPIYLKVTNEEPDRDFEFHNTWPVHNGSKTHLYLQEGKLQKLKPIEASSIDYKAVYGVQTGVEDYYGDDVLEKGLVFETAALEQDFRITGHPLLNVTFSIESDGFEDVDIFATLLDYDPGTKKAHQFSDGRLRTSLRSTAVPPYDFLGLPWHPANKEDIQLVRRGEQISLEIDLMPVSFLLKKGHVLKLVISNSMRGFYYLGKKAYEEDPVGYSSPLIRFYTGGDNKAELILPNIYG